MCRLLGFTQPGSHATLTSLLGPDQVAEYRNISVIHNDGWGASLICDSRRPSHISDGGAPSPELYTNLYKSTEPAYSDPTFPAFVNQDARSGVFHLRLASSHLPLILENQQPFSSDGITFCHNGDISGDQGINIVHNPHLTVSKEELRATGGKSDSAIYFAYILHYVSAGKSLPDAISCAVHQLRKNYPLSSYNCLVQTDSELICLNAYGHQVTSKRIIEVYQAYGVAHKAQDYRIIRYKNLPQGGILVASSGFNQPGDEGWKELENNHMLIASSLTGDYGIRHL